MNDMPIWTPSLERSQGSNFNLFVNFLKENCVDFVKDGYEEIFRWSIAEKETFWSSVWRYFDVIGSFDPENILEYDGCLFKAKWFPNARLNFAENLLRKNDDSVALIEHREDGRRRSFTYRDLREKSARLARVYRESGVVEGSRVVGVLPNGAEAVIAMLAAARLGAIWSSCSPDFGVQGIVDRFSQINPTVLVGVNGYTYNNKIIDTRSRLESVVEGLPSLSRWIAIDNNSSCSWPDSLVRYTCENSPLMWDDALKALPLDEFVSVSFDSPLYIVYSSGTTGVPKCIVHGVGGTLLQHIKELALHADIRSDDILFYYTTCGWVMWNWMVSVLALGATAVLYDGSPFSGEVERLWRMAELERITVFGSSAKYYAACEKSGVKPRFKFDLSSIKTMLSTGSPLSHETFDYIYKDVSADVCLSSMSGGTDIISAFSLGNPVLPVYRGELQCVGLGMDVDFVDDKGNSLYAGKGELVCRSPFPSMPLGFWGDVDGERYYQAYFDKFPNMWAHGDFGEFKVHSPDGRVPKQRGVVIHGRSDAVLNPGGVRIGTAEIYRQVEKVEEVLESIAIGQKWNGDVRVVLFVKLRTGLMLDDSLRSRISKIVRDNATPRHVPEKILQVEDIPKTKSGKIVELAVRNVVHGEEVKNTEALANPEALEYFRGREELGI